MDKLGWENPSILTRIEEINSMPTIWNNHYYYHHLSDEILVDSSLELHSDSSIDLDSVNKMVDILAPSFDSASDQEASDPDYFLQHQISPPSTLENFDINKDDGISVILPSSGESSGRSRHIIGVKRELPAQIFFDSGSEMKKARSVNIDFRREDENKLGYEPDTEAIAQVKEMMYRAATMRPVGYLGSEEDFRKKKSRKNVRISSDPQTVAARQRRERISEKLRILQKMVPGGSKMDTASMLDEAANYLKFLKTQLTVQPPFLPNFNHQCHFNFPMQS